MNITQSLARAFSIGEAQVQRTVELIDAGNTIPFIARYRKEATGGLDDQVLRELGERLAYLRSLDKRRGEIEAALTGQGVLTEELTADLGRAGTLSELEDIYRPFRPKRRTRATIARERGLEPLALRLMLQDPSDGAPEALAQGFVDPEKEVPDAQSALAGARDILAETISDDAASRARLRNLARATGRLVSEKTGDEDSVYRLYYAHEEPLSRMPGHRVLAVNRGEREGFLKVSVAVDERRATDALIRAFVRADTPAGAQVRLACEDAWARLIEPSLEREMRGELTERAEDAAIRVFRDNLRQLLMQPPVKGRVTLGVDPGFRTGCKLAVVDPGGKLLATGVGHFTIPGQTRLIAEAEQLVRALIERYGVTAVAIGNGTASREAEAFIARLIKDTPGVSYMIVSEAGASVYSASKLAAEEFPDYDVSLRSAVSIARRMQDPLAELVKIDPKSIGVGQYQHDLKGAALDAALSGVVEGCVNSVGVELSTASAALLAHVAGIGPHLAKNIVAYREEHGIKSRAELKKVPKLGPRAFEQCAGFLRLALSKQPLDRTAVHPESYAAAEALLRRLGHGVKELGRDTLSGLGEQAQAAGLGALAGEIGVGEPTLKDILRELMQPGRDPRDDLPEPLLRKDVLDIKDLKPGMELTGTVRNVADFGAFVDIGVHQDGLVHVSRLANRFVRHPSEVVKVGDVARVWVIEVDEKKGRISLSMVAP
ncbi:Tex family protein [Bacillota bacterium Meth-B3]|nr:Tex family protein [Christensenellaceae bacterium]